MRSLLLSVFGVVLMSSSAVGQTVLKDIPYSEPAQERHVLDIYAPDGAKQLPVVFWIHGGGWQAGDKSDVKLKPQWFNEKGVVFVSTNYRLLPHVDMGTIIRDVAKSVRWVHDNIAKHGGDPQRMLVGGHSAGAQLADVPEHSLAGRTDGVVLAAGAVTPAPVHVARDDDVAEARRPAQPRVVAEVVIDDVVGAVGIRHDAVRPDRLVGHGRAHPEF